MVYLYKSLFYSTKNGLRISKRVCYEYATAQSVATSEHWKPYLHYLLVCFLSRLKPTLDSEMHSRLYCILQSTLLVDTSCNLVCGVVEPTIIHAF